MKGNISRRSFTRWAAATAVLASGTWLQACSAGASSSTSTQTSAAADDTWTQAAAAALDARDAGSLVAIDAETGEVLVCLSKGDSDVAGTLHVPGSCFKIVTLAAALEAGTITTDEIFTAPASLTLMGGAIDNAGEVSYDPLTAADAFASSVNTVYAQIALRLGQQALASYAQTLGFGRTWAQGACAASVFAGDALSQLQLAWAGAGQALFSNNDPDDFVGPKATPLHMALIYAAFANGGTLYEPYGDVIGTPEPAPDARVVASGIASQETISYIQAAMRQVVTAGTGTAAEVSGANVCGKTGTAESGRGYNDCWFCGYADHVADGRRIAFSAYVTGESSSEACELAHDFISAW